MASIKNGKSKVIEAKESKRTPVTKDVEDSDDEVASMNEAGDEATEVETPTTPQPLYVLQHVYHIAQVFVTKYDILMTYGSFLLFALLGHVENHQQ